MWEKNNYSHKNLSLTELGCDNFPHMKTGRANKEGRKGKYKEENSGAC